MASVYNPSAYTKWQKEAQDVLSGLKGPEGGPLEGPLFVLTDFVMEKARTSKFVEPTGLRTGDIDNHQKTIYDVITKDGKWWKDDCQIIIAWASKSFGTPVIRVQCRELRNPDQLEAYRRLIFSGVANAF